MQTKHFFYKNQLFRFSYNLLANHSKYFQKKRKQFENLQIINLIEDTDLHQNLTETSIKELFNFFYNQEINLTHSDVIHVRFLSLKYDVSKLTQIADKYISKNYKEIIDLFLSDKENIAFNNCIEYEQIISDHLIEFIDEKQNLLSLPLSSLHRILLRYSFLGNKNEQFINFFMIEIAKKFGIQSTVLFNDILFKNEEKYLISIFHPFYDYVKNESIESKFMNLLFDGIHKMKIKIDQMNEENKINFEKQQKITNDLKDQLAKLEEDNKEMKKKLDFFEQKTKNEITQIQLDLHSEKFTLMNFNEMKISEQQLLISILIEKSKNDKTKNFFLNIKELLINLIGMNISDSCNYVNIKTNNSEEILMNIENELPIVIFPKAGKLIFSVNSPPFNMNIFKQFKNVFFYIEYPSKNSIYFMIK